MVHYPIRHADGSRDERYSVQLEYCGYEKPRYVLRFCDEFIGSFPGKPQAALRAVGHRDERNGGAIEARDE